MGEPNGWGEKSVPQLPNDNISTILEGISELDWEVTTRVVIGR